MPAIFAASSDQCATKSAYAIAPRNGARNEAAPRIDDGSNCLRKTIGSISPPAKNVSKMLPKPATKSIQALVRRPSSAPAATPMIISTSAAGIFTRIAISAASAASASQSAATSQMFVDSAMNCTKKAPTKA